jgi:hypothetical protein
MLETLAEGAGGIVLPRGDARRTRRSSKARRSRYEADLAAYRAREVQPIRFEARQ